MDNILDIQDLHTFFYTPEGTAKAVNGVSLSLKPGEILGLVGESGCGKSVTNLSVLRLISDPPGKIVSGKISLDGQDLLQLPKRDMRKIRGDRISMIFQEPMISLNPAYTIGNQLMEALLTHRKISRAEAVNRVVEMLQMVEIPSAEKRLKDYPHHLSGGMRQRVMIAEAMLLRPQVLLADEPTTALDVTIQAQVLELMYKLTEEFDTAIILVTHNLGIVAESAQRVAVMYTGRVIEEAPVKDLFESPRHPYTNGLLRSVPVPDQNRPAGREPLYEIEGIVPNLFDLPSGCSFHPRCSRIKDICRHEQPPEVEVGTNHMARCWLYA
ncbi:MAG: ABC transporter ATP-binding protein [Desulfobacteraceae bacterium]|nr:ABC transporter ATP-binding protein [Desulfobacteraceae bacterium]